MDDESRAENDRQSAAGDDLAPLLHLAGRRPRLPEGEVAPIREAVREVFRRQARRTAIRRRIGWLGTGLAAGLLLAVGLILRSPEIKVPVEPIARLEMRTGDVGITDAAGRQVAPQSLFAGAVLTTGDRGRAAVRLPAGASLRIDAGSSVRFDSVRQVTLERGAVYLDSGAAAVPGHGIEIATALGSVRDVGTQFEARLLPGESHRQETAAAALRVRVREGRVLVGHGGKVHQARAGGELVVQADGGLRRAEFPIYGAGWEWVQRAAPTLAIEGATLADFLDWASREAGLRWRLAEPRSGNAPEGIILHGSIEGLTAEEALDVVLPGCGYRHRSAGGELWLEKEGGIEDEKDSKDARDAR
jgi:FecR-like protein